MAFDTVRPYGSTQKGFEFLPVVYAVELQQASLQPLLWGIQISTQFRNYTPGGRSVRAVAGPGTGPFRLGIAIAPRLHVGSAAAVIVPVPGVVLPIAVLLQKASTGKGRGFTPPK